jgi:hypothetical protein
MRNFIYINNILQYLYIVNEIMEELCDERIKEREKEETEQAGFTFVKPKKPTSRGNQQTTVWSKSNPNPNPKSNPKYNPKPKF